MERFIFRPITPVDIAATVGKKATDIHLTQDQNGTIEIETPNLTAAKRTQLRALFTTRGLVEDTG